MRFHLAAIGLIMAILLHNQHYSDAAPSGMGSESSDTSIPILASGKRQHNIMRFGKRPSSGHSLIHFGKRDDPVPVKGHSFLYFGKRSSTEQEPSSFWDYFQKNRDGSYKRGHSIMRFGKRGPLDAYSFGHQAEDDEELDKRTGGHSMMYFGKRGTTGNAGHSMMYFGKRGTAGHSMMYFGKRDGGDEDFDKRTNGHSMMYFGKRDSDEDFDKRTNGHSMMYFGKRDGDEDLDKRTNGHAMMYFGKRASGNAGHSMMYFGKRDEEGEEDENEDKRAHSMIHFGKREDPRKGSHAMIHFGKRDDSEEDISDEAVLDGGPVPPFWNPQEMKRQHNLLRFGKKMDRKGSHAMIHFGKREDVLDEEDKRAHSMIHFGKRSADDDVIEASGNRSEKGTPLSRMKREVDPAPIMSLVRYDDDENPIASDDDGSSKPMTGIFGYPWEQRQEEDWEPNYMEFPDKKNGGKNVFLRFG